MLLKSAHNPSPYQLLHWNMARKPRFRICATNISFAYPEHTGGGSSILYRTSFQIPQGTLVAITGPRGSGKKTVLELVAGRPKDWTLLKQSLACWCSVGKDGMTPISHLL